MCYRKDDLEDEDNQDLDVDEEKIVCKYTQKHVAIALNADGSKTNADTYTAGPE